MVCFAQVLMRGDFFCERTVAWARMPSHAWPCLVLDHGMADAEHLATIVAVPVSTTGGKRDRSRIRLFIKEPGRVLKLLTATVEINVQSTSTYFSQYKLYKRVAFCSDPRVLKPVPSHPIESRHEPSILKPSQASCS